MLSAEGRLYKIIEKYPNLDLQLAGYKVHKIFIDEQEKQKHCGLVQYFASVRKMKQVGQIEKAFLAVASRPLYCSSKKSFVDCLLLIQRWARKAMHKARADSLI